MSFLRANTAKSMASRAWSTEELAQGLEHILTDGRLELPDDLSQLKDAVVTFIQVQPLTS